LICAIHSAFSVLVAAYTANDFFALMICHPFFKSEKKNKKGFFSPIKLL